MAGAWTSMSVKDGGGTSRNIRVWDESGAGTGPFSPGPIKANGQGTGEIAIAPVVSAAAEGSHVIKASAGVLYDWHVTVGDVPGYVMIFDATSAPADGAVSPVICLTVAAFQTCRNPDHTATNFTTGIVIVFSSTGPFTKTISATAFISAKAA